MIEILIEIFGWVGCVRDTCLIPSTCRKIRINKPNNLFYFILSCFSFSFSLFVSAHTVHLSSITRIYDSRVRGEEAQSKPREYILFGLPRDNLAQWHSGDDKGNI